MAMLFGPDTISYAMTIVALLLAGALLLMKRLNAKAPPGNRPFSDMPTPPGSNWIVGHLFQFNPSKMHLDFSAWANKLGGIYRVRVLNQNIVVVSDPKLFVPILGAGDEALPKHTMYQDFDLFESPNHNGNVFTTLDFHDECFRVARKELAMGFSMKQMKDVAVPSLITVGRSLAEKWGAAGERSAEVDHDIEVAVLDHILDSSFKINLSREVKDEFLERLKPALAEISLRASNPLRPMFQRLLPFLPSSKNVLNVMKGCHKMWYMVHDRLRPTLPTMQAI